jgi:transcriptional regulator GlxA family with amidase domain
LTIRDKQRVLAKHIGMMLVEGFPMMVYASVIEPFRAANVLSGAAW